MKKHELVMKERQTIREKKVDESLKHGSEMKDEGEKQESGNIVGSACDTGCRVTDAVLGRDTSRTMHHPNHVTRCAILAYLYTPTHLICAIYFKSRCASKFSGTKCIFCCRFAHRPTHILCRPKHSCRIFVVLPCCTFHRSRCCRFFYVSIHI
jgi:hypothetical protein